MSRFGYELFNGPSSPAANFIQWIPGWWYYCNGLPIDSGISSAGDHWLLIGSTLSGESPREVVQNYLSSGSKTIFKADGAFVIVINRSNNVIEIVRDRTGLIPVFYATGEKGITFSNWSKNVIKYCGMETIPSDAILEQYPIYRVSIPPNSPYKEVKHLPARYGLRMKDNQIFNIDLPLLDPEGTPYLSIDSASDDLGERLSNAIKKRIPSGKKIGAWLSGGIDSSLIVALMRKHYTGNIKTVFISFEEYNRNYEKYAKEVAEKYATDHAELIIGRKDYVNNWVDAITILQAPLNNPGSAVGQETALRALDGNIDVMLSGVGADTIFGGPYRAPMMYLSYYGKYLPDKYRDIIRGLSTMIAEKYFISKSIAMSLRALGTPFDTYIHSENAFGKKLLVDQVFMNDAWEKTLHTCKNYIKDDNLTDLFYFHMLNWHPATVSSTVLLGYQHNVFFHFPFWDYDLVRNSRRIPINIRYHYRTKKAALKRYAENYFKPSFINKSKEGFGVPLGKWFAQPEFASLLYLPLEERSIKRGWWNEKALKNIIKQHKLGNGTDETAEIIPWMTVNMELWARICIEGDSPDLYKI